MQRLFALVALVIAPSLDPPAAAQARESDYLESIVAAQSQLIDDLEDLADWCRANKLLLEADVCYRNLLRFDEEHERARASLRYTKRKGEWVQASSYRQPRNYSKEALIPFAAKRLEMMQTYKRAILDLNASHAQNVSLERRERVLLELLDLTPDDPEVRSALGETLIDGEWKLVETKTAFERRAGIPELAQRCIATAPIGKAVPPNGVEQAIGLDWKLILATDYVRVAGTSSPEEVRNVMRVTQGAGEFFRTLLENDTLPGVEFAIFLLSSDAEKRQFLDKHPRVNPRDRPFLESLEGAGIPGSSQTAEWSQGEHLRLDRSTRQTLGKMMSDTYGITVDHGWAWEGFGYYLTYQLTGTRLTFFLSPDRYGSDPNATAEAKQLFTRMLMPECDWLKEARIFFAERRPPKLAILMGRKVDTLSAPDVLWSYVLASYLIEGCPEKAPVLLTAIGGEKLLPPDAVRKAFDMELPRFEQRVVRWLDETR